MNVIALGRGHHPGASRRALSICAGALLFFADKGLVSAAPERSALLLFSGNEVLNDEVYRAVVDLPKEVKATPGNARLVRARILDFLHRAGYELAFVEARVKGDQILVELDEGRVDKVIVIGQGAFQTLRFKLELSLPHNVFNRPLLERQLRVLADLHDIRRYRWELVPIFTPKHVGPQLEALPEIAGFELLAPRSPYELHILLERAEWETGFTPELSFGSFEGLRLGASYRGDDLALSSDRWEIHGRAAVALRKTLEGNERLVLSRAILETRWHTPPLIGDQFRSFLWVRGDLLNHQRRDLGLESFFYAPLEASVNLEYEIGYRLTFSLGGGLEQRTLLAVDPTPDVNPVVDATPDDQTRPFAVAASSYVFNPDEIRRDRKHELSLEGRFFDRAERGRERTVRASLFYQKVFLLGWHELWIRGGSAILSGDVLFPDELAVGGQYLRGVFSEELYARKAANASLEFRLSVARDLFKIGLFHDAVSFGLIDRDTDRESLAFANAFGVGFHVLVIDAFQLDIYGALGFATGKLFDQSVNINFRQAY